MRIVSGGITRDPVWMVAVDRQSSPILGCIEHLRVLSHPGKIPILHDLALQKERHVLSVSSRFHGQDHEGLAADVGFCRCIRLGLELTEITPLH